MACQRKLPPASTFSLSLNLNDAHATFHRTVLLQSAQFENENGKDDYRHKFTDGRKEKSKEKQSKEGKTFFSANEIKLCMLYYRFFCIFIVMKTYVLSYTFFSGSFFHEGKCFQHYKFSIYDKKDNGKIIER